MKPLTAVGLALLAFLVGGLVCRGDRGSEAAQRTADSLQVLADSFADIDAHRAIAMRADSQRLARLAVENQRLAVRGATSQRRADSLGGLVLDTASVVPRPIYDATVQEYRGLVQVREVERDSARAEAGIWKVQAFAADSSARRWEGLAQAYRVQLQQALKRSKWGCYGGIGASLGYGFVGDRPGVGTVAGLGVTCGKRL
jgi:hypothetical protein